MRMGTLVDDESPRVNIIMLYHKNPSYKNDYDEKSQKFENAYESVRIIFITLPICLYTL